MGCVCCWIWCSSTELWKFGSLSEGEFAAVSLRCLRQGLFFVSPYVAILTLGLNLFGMTVSMSGRFLLGLPISFCAS